MNNPATFAFIDRGDLERMIQVLKTLDVRGYDSMNSLVATVVFLEGVLLRSAQQNTQSQPAANPEPQIESGGKNSEFSNMARRK